MRQYSLAHHLGVCGIVLAGLMGCSALDVSSPTTLLPKDVTNADGVTLAVNQARYSFGLAASMSILQSGLLADEFSLDAEAGARGDDALLDRRQSVDYQALTDVDNYGGARAYILWQTAWRDVAITLSFVRNYAIPAAKGTQLAEVFATRGFIMLGLAEQICPGFPIRDVDVNGDAWTPRHDNPPMTTDAAFTRALAEFDSALAYAATDSARVLNMARLGKARALLGLGQMSAAGAVAATVDPNYVAKTLDAVLQFYSFFPSGMGMVAESEGLNGMNYVSAADPRAPLTPLGDAANGSPVTKYAPQGYDGFNVPVIFASGQEAQLIQAEAQLAAGDATWLTTLNNLRGTAGMSDTIDPGTAAARVNLVYHERAFWLFGTGHRLGDMRRLISRYGRDPESVFPTGVNRVGDPYGTATSIPFPGNLEHRFNSTITGCTSR